MIFRLLIFGLKPTPSRIYNAKQLIFLFMQLHSSACPCTIILVFLLSFACIFVAGCPSLPESCYLNFRYNEVLPEVSSSAQSKNGYQAIIESKNFTPSPIWPAIISSYQINLFRCNLLRRTKLVRRAMFNT